MMGWNEVKVMRHSSEDEQDLAGDEALEEVAAMMRGEAGTR